MSDHSEPRMDKELAAKFGLLQDAPKRSKQRSEAGKAAFMLQAQEYARQAVTNPQPERHKGWFIKIQNLFSHPRKEKSPMASAVTTIILIASIILGGGGVTTVAAQSSQPDQPLYGVKILSEDVRLQLTADPQEKLELALEFANRRIEEMQLMTQSGSDIPTSVQARYQEQLEIAMQLAAGMPNEQAVQAMEQIRTRLQTQNQALQQVEVNGSNTALMILQQTRQMIQDRLSWVEEGLTNPDLLQERLRQMLQDRDRDPSQTCTPDGSTSKPEDAGNPWTTGTPTPGSGYGPGDGTCETCTPGGNTGTGGNQWIEGTPTPGSGYGYGAATGTIEPGTGGQPTTAPGGPGGKK